MVIKKEIDFRVIIDNMDQPINIVNPKTYRILYANKIIQEIYQESLVGKLCYNALQGLGSPCGFCINDKLFGEDPISPQLWDYYNKKIDKWFHCFVYAIDWDEGKKVRFEIATDITESQSAKQELKESEEKFRNITEQNLMGIYIVQDNVIKYINKAMADIYGYSIEEILNWEPMGWLKILAPDTLEFSKEQALKKQSGESNQIIHYKVHGVKKTGEFVWIDNFSRAIIYEGRPADLVSQIDITEKLEAEQKIKESEEKYRDAFNQTDFYKDLLAHDIGNILNNIKSFIDLNRMWEGKEEKRKNRGDIMKLIKGQVDRGASLINNVRRLTEVEKSEIILESVNVKALLKDVIKPIYGQFDKKKANLNIEKTQDAFNVKGGDFLIDVFDNIIRNGAIHNDNEQIELNIKLLKIQKEGENFIKLEFLDNGRGISDLRKKSIFDWDYQQDRRRGRQGIGLSLVKKIIGLYGGQIWVEDRIPGDYSKGSNFIVLLKEAK